MSNDHIYLDYASTHPRREEVMAARREFENTSYANIGRGNYDLAEAAMVAYQHSKKTVARWIGCEPLEVLYTYSATYALNLLALAMEHNGVLQKGDTILLSLSEHHANIVPWQMLAERVGAVVKFVGLDDDYCLDLDDLKNTLDDTVKVVSFQYASNVTGAVHPMNQVREIIGSERLFIVDASQMGTHGPLEMSDMHCDALVLSGHKMMADTGIGVLALWKVLQKAWQSPVGGGGAINFVHQDGSEQAGIPERWEPGTPHITGAVTLGAAVECLAKITPTQQKNYLDLLNFIDVGFEKYGKGLQVFHSRRSDSIGVWSFFIPGKHPSDVVDVFSQVGICLRSGHHCCEPLHQYLGVNGTVRMSIGYDTTRDEVERFFAVLDSLLL
ncbi:aminotransferase class V-fold PLP-dependent enzyme [Candidatus Gracilibacteria bacterium]|nr:aminotransferase class V-fold PLP-dependent enzyme [Candidatus Gracilibacteria bacterium]